MKSLILTTVCMAGLAFAQSSPAQIDKQATAGAQQGDAQSSQGENKDTLATQALRDRFAKEPAFHDVITSVEHGIATLSGAVRADGDRVWASELAAKIAGVDSVKNIIRVASSDSSASSSPRAAAAHATQQIKAQSDAAPTTTASGSAVPSAAGSIAGNTIQRSGAVQVGSDQTSNPGTMPNAAAQSPGTATLGSSGMSRSGASLPPAGTTSGSAGLPQSDASANSNSALEVQIKNALRNEPMLSTSVIAVAVTDATIELSGNASTSKDKQTAERIAQSYSGNKHVVSKISLTGPSAVDRSTSVSNNPPQNNPPQNRVEPKPAIQPSPR